MCNNLLRIIVAGENHLASIVSFVELCGHDKYAKTALFGAISSQTAASLTSESPQSSQRGG